MTPGRANAGSRRCACGSMSSAEPAPILRVPRVGRPTGNGSPPLDPEHAGRRPSGPPPSPGRSAPRAAGRSAAEASGSRAGAPFAQLGRLRRQRGERRARRPRSRRPSAPAARRMRASASATPASEASASAGSVRRIVRQQCAEADQLEADAAALADEPGRARRGRDRRTAPAPPAPGRRHRAPPPSGIDEEPDLGGERRQRAVGRRQRASLAAPRERHRDSGGEQRLRGTAGEHQPGQRERVRHVLGEAAEDDERRSATGCRPPCRGGRARLRCRRSGRRPRAAAGAARPSAR